MFRMLSGFDGISSIVVSCVGKPERSFDLSQETTFSIDKREQNCVRIHFVPLDHLLEKPSNSPNSWFRNFGHFSEKQTLLEKKKVLDF
jgi:hypothetical protein